MASHGGVDTFSIHLSSACSTQNNAVNYDGQFFASTIAVVAAIVFVYLRRYNNSHAHFSANVAFNSAVDMGNDEKWLLTCSHCQFGAAMTAVVAFVAANAGDSVICSK